MDPHIFADPDPDPGSQNLADPTDPDTDPDPKHCFLHSIYLELFGNGSNLKFRDDIVFFDEYLRIMISLFNLHGLPCSTIKIETNRLDGS